MSTKSIATVTSTISNKMFKKRILKRNIIKQKKVEFREQLLKHRLELHKQIDENLKQINKKEIEKNEHDKFQEEIRFKLKRIEQNLEKSTKYVLKLSGIISLRSLRKSDDLPTFNKLDDKFLGEITNLSDLWYSHIRDLNLEKDKLKLLLDSTKIYFTKERCDKLFGDPNYNPDPLKRMSVDELIHVRKYWDQFIVDENDPNGSYIPFKYIADSDTD